MPKKNSDESPFPQYLGGNAFPEGFSASKPIAPGRHPKPLEGPVHPGFKGKPKPPQKPQPPSQAIGRSDKTDDVYHPPKKKS